MTNRQSTIERLKANISQYLREEIEHKLNIDREESDEVYDTCDALLEIYDMAECNSELKLIKECRLILIDLGFYRIMPQSEIDNTTVSRGTVWDFKIKGTAYTSDSTFNDWPDNESNAKLPHTNIANT